jgi:hypothetical protein
VEKAVQLRARFCAAQVTTKMAKKIPVLIAYPRFSVIDKASPPVLPSVVAAILMIQNVKVTRGTLFFMVPAGLGSVGDRCPQIKPNWLMKAAP